MIDIQEAGPMNVMRTIVIIVLIYYVFKILARIFAPFLMKKMVNKMQQKAEEQFGRPQPNVNEGETIIEKKPKTSTKSKNDVGEYVDFEEID